MSSNSSTIPITTTTTTIRPFNPLSQTDIMSIKQLLNASWDSLEQEIKSRLTIYPQQLSDIRVKSLSTLFTSQDKTVMWVATLSENTNHIVGVVGMIPGRFDAELVRMSVDVNYQRHGIAKRLCNHVLEYASQLGFQHVFLTCGSKSGQSLYEHVGFTQFFTYHMMVNNENVEMGKLYVKRTTSPRRKIQNVIITGGIHGNELIGSHLVGGIWKSPIPLPSTTDNTTTNNNNAMMMPIIAPAIHSDLVRSHLKVYTSVANPQALYRNVRFIEKDLNRCFHQDDLYGAPTTTNNDTDTNTSNHKRIRTATTTNIDEIQVARTLNEAIGPKPQSSSQQQQQPSNQTLMDINIDLHSTASNMGLTMIVLQGDPFTFQLFKYLRQEKFPTLSLLVTPQSRYDNNNIDSVTTTGICFEVGPLIHGTLQTSLLDSTRLLVIETLNYLNEREIRRIQQQEENNLLIPNVMTIPVYEFWKVIKFPLDPSNNNNGLITGVLHPKVCDFVQLQKGDPLFISINHPHEIIATYDEDEPGWPVFVNEPAYFENKIAFCLCRFDREKICW
jgi:aspartoacylase